jgi:citrate:succinate antiporter/L-tartrate/succinate antiporter
MWTAFASTAVTSSMFLTALVPNASALALAERTMGFELGWWGFFTGFAPAGLLLLALVPLLTYLIYPPELRDSPETVVWAGEELRRMGPVSRKEWTMAALIALAVVLWVTGSNPRVSLPILGTGFIHPTAVVLVVVSRMLVLRVIAWDDVLGEREAWGVLLYFTMVLTLASGLHRIGFVEWLARTAAAPLVGVDPLVAMFALVALFFWSHYLFASITAHAAAVLPVVLAIGHEIPGVPGVPLAMLCIYSLGLMGVISPYATGCAPIYAGSGFIGRGRFWWLGLVFGLVFFAALAGVAGPWVMATMPVQ